MTFYAGEFHLVWDASTVSHPFPSFPIDRNRAKVVLEYTPLASHPTVFLINALLKFEYWQLGVPSLEERLFLIFLKGKFR